MITTTGLSLATRKNIRDEFQNKIPELQKTLNKLTGSDYEFHVDFATLYEESVRANSSQTQWYKSSMGQIAYQYFESIVSNIKRVAENDDLVRSDFIKVTNKHEIHLVNDSEINGDNDLEIVDGIIHIKVRPGQLGYNASVGYYILNYVKVADETIPLRTKINIRDGWELKIPNIKKTLKKVLGEDYDFVVNFDEIYAQAIKERPDYLDWYSSSLGDIVYGYFDSLKGYIHRYAEKDELVRNELLKLTATRKIHLVYDSDLETNELLEVKNDAFWIKTRPKDFGSSTSIGYYLIDRVKDPDSALPLRTKVDVRDEWELKIPKLKQRLKSLLGEDYGFEIDLDEIYSQIIKANKSQHDWYTRSLGSITCSYFDSLISNIEKTASDDLARKEFLEATSSRTFHLVLDMELESNNDVEIVNGDLNIKVDPKNYGYNVYIGTDISKKIKAPGSAFPLETKLNIRNEWELKITALKKKLKEAVGEEYEFVVDFEELLNIALEKNSNSESSWLKRSLGEIVYQYYGALVDNVIKVAKDDDLVREGFVEVTGERKIYLVYDSNCESNCDLQVVDDAVYIKIKPGSLGRDSYYVGHNIIDIL
ncbi:3621_t:CDS:1 [Paraglomus brasilianum]|uniref:3621_t:CDS:1 n=1 Tax=Paraglomus brasilianum TaxID=144538 RepID=A0A9N8Z675_9GLOM|nr:3621_t:CDS:1 [Paraglomus brasilianum]